MSVATTHYLSMNVGRGKTVAAAPPVSAATSETFNFTGLGNTLGYTIIWGDGTANGTFTSSGTGTGSAAHTYAAVGTYTITVYNTSTGAQGSKLTTTVV